MPLIRRAQGKDVQFSVSPWQVKQTLSQPEGEQIYQETLLPYKPDQPLIPAAAAETKQTVKAKARPHAFEGGWQTRKKPTPLDNLQPATAVNSLLPGSNQKQTSETDPDEQETSQHQQPGTIFEGTAVLAFLQNGQLSGRAQLYHPEPACCPEELHVSIMPWLYQYKHPAWKQLCIAALYLGYANCRSLH